MTGRTFILGGVVAGGPWALGASCHVVAVVTMRGTYPPRAREIGPCPPAPGIPRSLRSRPLCPSDISPVNGGTPVVWHIIPIGICW